MCVRIFICVSAQATEPNNIANGHFLPVMDVDILIGFIQYFLLT